MFLKATHRVGPGDKLMILAIGPLFTLLLIRQTGGIGGGVVNASGHNWDVRVRLVR